MAPKRRCPVCRSKQWHKEAHSGLIACSEGHVLQNYRNEAIEADDLGPYALRKRTLKSRAKKKGKWDRTDPKLYHGARGRYFYFLCQQLLLRKQIEVLRRLWVLPPEFEIVCRDIWALHLSLLPDPPPAEPYFYSQEVRESNEGDDSSIGGQTTGKAMELSKMDTADTPLMDTKDDSKNDDSSLSSSSSSSDEDEDAELASLLRENSEISSSSEGEDAVPLRAAPAAKERRKRQGRDVHEGMSSTVAVLMLGCWTMRVPVLYLDFMRIIESYELPYLDPVRLLPPSMVVHLTKHNIQALSPAHAPNTLSLHALTSSLAKRMYSSYGVFTPEANAAPILWRVTQCLGGTPTLYNLTKRLSRVLSLPLTLHPSLAPGLRRVKTGDPARHKYDNVPPELGFIAAAIVVLKMVYGLDGRIRLPREADDPACALARVEDYLGLLRNLNEEDARKKDAVFDSQTPMNVGDLEDAMVDEYLDFCERALLGSEDETQKDVTNTLSNFFPLKVSGGDKEPDALRVAVEKDRAHLKAALPEEDDQDEKLLRPGESHRIYHAGDVLGSVPEDYELVLSRAARWIGVGSQYMSCVVEKYERRLMRWWKAEKKRRRERETSEGVSE